VVEDVPGENLEALLRQDPRSAGTAMARLAGALDAMQRHQGQRFGKVALIDKGGASKGSSCEQVVLDRALDDLTEAASRDTRLTPSRDRLETVVRKLAAAVRPRSQYRLIHGELGPDHVLVGRQPGLTGRKQVITAGETCIYRTGARWHSPAGGVPARRRAEAPDPDRHATRLPYAAGRLTRE